MISSRGLFSYLGFNLKGLMLLAYAFNIGD